MRNVMIAAKENAVKEQIRQNFILKGLLDE
jgi:hypothetical protein